MQIPGALLLDRPAPPAVEPPPSGAAPPADRATRPRPSRDLLWPMACQQAAPEPPVPPAGAGLAGGGKGGAILLSSSPCPAFPSSSGSRLVGDPPGQGLLGEKGLVTLSGHCCPAAITRAPHNSRDGTQLSPRCPQIQGRMNSPSVPPRSALSSQA